VCMKVESVDATVVHGHHLYVINYCFYSHLFAPVQYGLDELKLRFRTQLSRHLYDKYLR